MRWRSCACSSWRVRAAGNAVRFRGEGKIFICTILFSKHRRTCAYNLFSLRKERSISLPMTIELAPSILSANFARLGEEAKAALDGGGTVLHVDVLDGYFVPNITIGPLVVASLRKALPDAILDCYLMFAHRDLFITAFASDCASCID